MSTTEPNYALTLADKFEQGNWATAAWAQDAAVQLRLLCAENDTLRNQSEDRRAQIERMSGYIHTCGPNCTKAGCVNARLSEENEALLAGVQTYQHAREALALENAELATQLATRDAELATLRAQVEALQKAAEHLPWIGHGADWTEAKPVYLVATGEVHDGQETYTRHDSPVPMADQEVLFTRPPQPLTRPAVPDEFLREWAKIKPEQQWNHNAPDSLDCAACGMGTYDLRPEEFKHEPWCPAEYARAMLAAAPQPPVEVAGSAVPETEMHEPKCAALDGGDCTCTRSDKHDQAVDRSWARFCAKFGDGPDAPYPGMISAFERYYSQSFADKEWRTESAVWAAAWKAAMLAAALQPPGEVSSDDLVLVPRGLLGSACAVLCRSEVPHTETLAELRRYTVGDLSAAAPQPEAQKGGA